jgi:glycosyltransferase involved in cell wall biosynthesis
MMTPTERRFHILQVNLQSHRGGDGRIVSSLHEAYRELGYDAKLLVGRGALTVDDEALLPNDEYRSSWARSWLSFSQRRSMRRQRDSTLEKLTAWIAEPSRRWRIRSGYEDFDFPATLPAIQEVIATDRPTVVHLHNLHGGYFDLRVLPELSRIAPIVLTLHDQWTFTGHCAYSFECQRWRSGCGSCPDLTTYPGIPRDRTAENFALKREVFSRARIHVTTPSKWLMEQARRSLLAPAIEDARVIPNGVDTTVFRPGDKAIQRSRLGLPSRSKIVLCAGSVARRDYQTDRDLLHSLVEHMANTTGREISIVFLGSATRSDESCGSLRIIHRPFERDVTNVAAFYVASDVFLHVPRADNYPTAVLEALSCGTPVVATSVGGIPEQVDSLWASENGNAHPPTTATGILVDPGDAAGLVKAIDFMLRNDDIRLKLARNASMAGASTMSIKLQARRTLDWYREILSRPSHRTDVGAHTRDQRQGQLQ